MRSYGARPCGAGVLGFYSVGLVGGPLVVDSTNSRVRSWSASSSLMFFIGISYPFAMRIRALGQRGWFEQRRSISATGLNSKPGLSCVPWAVFSRVVVRSLALRWRMTMLCIAVSGDSSNMNGDGVYESISLLIYAPVDFQMSHQ